MRHLETTSLAAALLSATCALGLAAPPAQAAPIRFGFTGVHALPQSRWDAMDRAARIAFLEHRGALASTLGGEVMRLGSVAPTLVTWEEVDGGETHRDWRYADAVVGALSGHGVDLCLTVPDLVGTTSIAVGKDFVASLAERYDGDVDFGVAPTDRNHEFPNIDGSELITDDDWSAPTEELQAWAEAHRIALVEPGDEPRRVEQTGQLDPGDYGALLKAARAGVEASGSDLRLMLAGVAIEDQSKAHFTERLAPLEGDGAPWFDAANVHLRASAGELTQAQAVAQVRKLQDWLASVGHADAERWIGEVAFGSSPRPDGPCTDPRCSERTQAGSLVRLVASAAGAGVPVFLYAEPIEVAGEGVPEGPRTGTGLLVLELQGDLDPTVLPLTARPAWAVWRRLQGLLAGVDTDDVEPMAGMPANAHGFRMGDAGWIVWHDWTREVSPGEPYDGTAEQVVLEAVDAPSLRVTSLWPEDVGEALDDGGRVEATWPEEVVPVVDGEASVLLGQDPVWIARHDQVITPDTGAAADTTADVSGGDVVAEADAGAGGGGGGCGLGGDAPGWPLLLLAGLVVGAAVVRRGRRRPAR